MRFIFCVLASCFSFYISAVDLHIDSVTFISWDTGMPSFSFRCGTGVVIIDKDSKNRALYLLDYYDDVIPDAYKIVVKYPQATLKFAKKHLPHMDFTSENYGIILPDSSR